MVVKKYIAENLSKLDKKFSESLVSPDSDLPVYFSKLATIEYCGWLEETMDGIVFAYAKKRLKTQSFRDILKGTIANTYGFQYKKHFRPMLVHVVGIVRCERIQSALEKAGDLATLESELSTYVVHRNNAAHTHIQNIASYPSPSATLGSMCKVYPILKKIYTMRKDGRYC
jgi:hypothetical protein